MPIKFLNNKKVFFFPLGVGGFFPFVYCLLTSYLSYSQSDILKYAHQIIDTLASPSMHGRGYVLKGDSIAADYIKKEFEKFGLKPIGREFYQRFNLSVVTFPDIISMSVNNKQLTLGKDFIILNCMDHKKGDFSVVRFDKKIISKKNFDKKFRKKDFSNKIVLLDTSEMHFDDFYSRYKTTGFLNNGVVYIEKKKLTSDISQYRSDIPAFVILSKSIPAYPKTISYEISAKPNPDYQSKNVIGYIQGSQYPDSFLVFTAHYDHLGMMGKDVYFPGANDNASGCAMLLNLAKYYSQRPPKYSVAFMAFGSEEVGLLGSKYYIHNQLFNINQIKFLINFDIVGTGEEGIKVVNATEHKKEFDELMKINKEKKYLPVVQPRGKASISDHYFFEEAGVKTFYIYTLGGIKAYHDIYDRPETLPLTKFEELYKLVIDFSDTLQK